MRDAKGRFIKGHKLGNRFKKGNIPHNKGKKGYTNRGSFKSGHGCFNTGRTWFKKQGEYFIDEQGYCKTHLNGKKVRLHQIVWCEANRMGCIPEGMCVHHKDLDKMNNHPDNLILLPHDFHIKLHHQIRKIRGD